jgi:hypothetical protein
MRQKPIGCERRSALRWARCDLGSRLRTLPRRRPHAWAWPICRGPARLTTRANGIRSRPRSLVGRRTLDYVGGPKSRKTGPPRSCDRAFKRLVGIDSPIRDKSVSGESRGRRELVDVAQSQVATVATMLSDEIGKKLENVIDRLPGGINVRRLIESSVQIALAAALEGLLRKRTRA